MLLIKEIKFWSSVTDTKEGNFFFWLPTTIIDEKNFVLVTDYPWQKLFLITFDYYQLLLISLIKLVFIDDIKQFNYKTYLLIMKRL